MTTTSSPTPATRQGRFAPTRWTVVLTAKQENSTEAEVALEELCRIYWPPIYGFIRQRGHSAHDAQDFTQGFFAHLLSHQGLANVDPAKGRFRSFLLASLKHYLINAHIRANAQKRGGGIQFVPLDWELAETSCAGAGGMSAEQWFDRQWALALLERVLQRLQEEYTEDGKAVMFATLKDTLSGDRNSVPYAVLATQLGCSEGALKVAVHRLRQRYRELLRAEVASTVADRAEVETELRHLFVALAS